MGLFKSLTLKLGFLFTLLVSAQANAYWVYHHVDPSPDVLIAAATVNNPAQTYTFTHDINATGFIAGNSTVSAAMLEIHLTDRNGGTETYQIQIGAPGQFVTCGAGNCVPGGTPGTGNGIFNNVTLNNLSLSDLIVDGAISVTLTALSGSYTFADSTLYANVIPEPGMLALLGLGLLGLGFARKRLK